MTFEMLKALFMIMQVCYSQDNCEKYPLQEVCGKMPCEW